MADKFEKFSFENEFFDVAVLDGLVGSKSARAANDAREEGFKDGLAQGRAEADALMQQEVAALTQQMQTLTAKLTAQQNQWHEAMTREALTLLRTTLHKLVGHAAEHYSDHMLEHHIKHLLTLLPQGEGLSLRVNPQAKAYHEKLGLPQASIGNIPFKIVTDPSLGITDVLMEWPGGGLEAKLAENLANVDALLAQVGADVTQPVPPLPTESHIQPEASTASPLDMAAKQTDTRVKELLGDDDLVDALK
ncbi:MAG: FliH/SctL family protein [Alphaproteobacteria bacterium]